MRFNEDDTMSQYIAALYYLGKADLLTTVPAVNIVQCVAAHFGSRALAGTLAGVLVVAGQIYRQTNDLDPRHDLFVQELWPDWEERDDGDRRDYMRALQFANSALNNDPEAAAILWITSINEETSSEDDTEFIYRLMEDVQHIIIRFAGDDADEGFSYLDDEEEE